MSYDDRLLMGEERMSPLHRHPDLLEMPNCIALGSALSMNTLNYCMCHQGHIRPGVQHYRKSVLIQPICVGDGKYRQIRCDILEEFIKAGKQSFSDLIL